MVADPGINRWSVRAFAGDFAFSYVVRLATTTPLLLAALTVASCHAKPVRPASAAASGPSRYLFLWAGDADKADSDFLAVVGADPHRPDYASVVATLPVDVKGSRPHHTEYEMPAGGVLWANGFDASRTFLFDLRDPPHPAIRAAFGDPDPFGHPHSYARLPNGGILATMQWEKRGDQHETGGLVEFDAGGKVLRTVRASAPATDATIRPYSLVVLPALDRVVTTATDMHLQARSRAVQIWRLSDLALLQTLLLPPGSRGDEQWLTAEPRALPDGRVLVNTFTCGLYLVSGLGGATASAEWVHSSPWDETRDARRFCAVPVLVEHFWIQTSGPEHAVISLDVSDPRHPREVGRLALGPDDVPHWIAIEPGGDRLVITGYNALESRVLLARIDRRTGALSLDTSFKAAGASEPGVDFGRAVWPHGSTGKAIPHGAVFSRPS
jgi:hypothetical protein